VTLFPTTYLTMSQESLLMKTLEKELQRYDGVFREIADTTINNNVSNYPIFIALQKSVEIGIPLISKEQSGTFWSYHISTLEELVTKNIIHSEKIEPFKRVYKDPSEFICLFVVEEKGATFVFYPYK